MKVLIIAAHPDDEVLGAGATASALSRQGADVHIHILAEGVSLRHSGVTIEQARARCLAAAKELGVARVTFGGLAADGRLLADLPQRQVVDAVRRSLDEAKAEVVFTHHPGDIHADHRSVAQAVGYGTRLLGAGPVRQVLHFEVLSSTEQQTGLVAPFTPNVFYEVTGHVEAKCRALAAYPYEVHDAPHPRSLTAVRTLASYRGTQAGVEAAEAFVSGRELRRPDVPGLSGGDVR
ncbi:MULTISPECIES: PIG-L deacetylase family protein [Streptomyces]|uniref:LmbE family protein n=1 Tax=Streptomyces amritsarensis TaxID=681158 RepID=A0ABX3G866_9ACTN|nr:MULTISPECIES: PIG-L deacetylase family protein [Streptomyces]AQT74805.1 LmbE family protein [Streptomyces sp. fd1-xmd]MDX6759549.1 PIG-L deacetylase family protein [Streptomyces sp. F8]OLZ71762.1 LmbE family protein [Streptomyces amritsarensis]